MRWVLAISWNKGLVKISSEEAFPFWLQLEPAGGYEEKYPLPQNIQESEKALLPNFIYTHKEFILVTEDLSAEIIGIADMHII